MQKPAGLGHRPLASVGAPRNTRFSCFIKANQPPDVRKIIGQLKRQGPIFIGQPSVRALVASASRQYESRGAQDDLVRFLVEVEVLICTPLHGKQKMYYDDERAMEILQCCERLTNPEKPKTPVDARIARIIEVPQQKLHLVQGSVSNENAEPISSVVAKPIEEIPEAIKRILSDHSDDTLYELYEFIPKEIAIREERRREERRKQLAEEIDQLERELRTKAREKENALAAAAVAEKQQSQIATRAQQLDQELERLKR